MIIDCHGHYATAPKALEGWRTAEDRLKVFEGNARRVYPRLKGAG